MKLILLIVSVACFGGLAHASEVSSGFNEMLQAITLCQSPNNPLTDGLVVLKGDLFADVKSSGNVLQNTLIISAQAVASPNSRNLSISAPNQIVGEVIVKLRYERLGVMDRPLKCELTLNPYNR